MQAARSAAIADGLVPKATTPPSGNPTTNTSKSKTNETIGEGNAQQQGASGDTLDAALALVAACNGGKAKTPAAAAPQAQASTMTSNGSSSNSAAANLSMRQLVDASRAAQSNVKHSVSSNINANSNARARAPSSTSPAISIPGAVTKVNASNSLSTSQHSSGVSTPITRNTQVGISPLGQGQGQGSLRPQPSASLGAAQQNKTFTSAGVRNPASAGSAAHRLAVANSTPVAPKPTMSASSHISKPTNTTSAPTAPRSSSNSSGTGGKKKGPPLRRGKWTPEEEAYANRLIMEFKAGLLPLTDGTTLRTFLSKLLNCDPMRISKKFVGSNCIGKQVFRRRTADINRLTPEQIQQSRAELSELERRFLERVAQTNRVKSSGVNNNSNNNSSAVASAAAAAKMGKATELDTTGSATPPWLRPPNGFKHGTGAATAAATLSSGSNRAALAGRALLSGGNDVNKNGLQSSLSKSGSAGLLALMELQQRQNRGNAMPHHMNNTSSSILGAGSADNGKNGGRALEQLRRNVSASKMGGLASSNSMTNLMMKTGLSRDQLSQLVREHRINNSSNSLSNMMERQSSLDALMSLDFQSMQSIDNLANLIQSGKGNQVPRSGLNNWSSDNGGASTNNLAAVTAAASIRNSNSNLSSLADARRLQSEGRMENLIRSLSSGNMANRANINGDSNANFNTLLQSMHSSNNLLGGTASALNLANMLRVDSSTGLTALRMQDGLAQRNTSVDDFLSLVASGDIPHQDPHMLNVPLQSVLHHQQNNGSAAAQILAQQQLLQAAHGGNALNRFASLSGLSNNGNGGLANSSSTATLGGRIASLGGLANHNSAASLLNQYASQQHQQQHDQNSNMHASVLAAAAQQENSMKRKFADDGGDGQRPLKR